MCLLRDDLLHLRMDMEHIHSDIEHREKDLARSACWNAVLRSRS